MPSRSLLLFDVDGTILNTRGAGMRAMRRVARDMFGDGFRWDGVNAAGHLDPLIYRDAALLNRIANHEDHADRFHRTYIEALGEELTAGVEAVEVLPGVLDLLATLRRRAAEQDDIVLGLLTGNFTAATPLKLNAIDVDIDWFDITAFGDDADSRPGLVAHALQQYEARFGHAADRRRVIVIGDTPRDVACAHAHDCVAFAVATGGYTLDQLAAQHPDHLVSDLRDPQPLLDLLVTDAPPGRA